LNRISAKTIDTYPYILYRQKSRE